MVVNGNLKKTEISEVEAFEQAFALSGDRYQTLVLESGYLFDIGLSVYSQADNQYDALYLADGSWGIDYTEESGRVDGYEISEQNYHPEDGTLVVGRAPYVSGEIKNTMNLFRQILPGELTLNVEAYNSIRFTLQSTHKVEVVLMQKDLADWNDRFIYNIEASDDAKEITIPITAFQNRKGEYADVKDVQRIVFSMNGNGQSYEPFDIEVQNLQFTKALALNTNAIAESQSAARLYPNPMKSQLQIELNEVEGSWNFNLYDVAGRMVDRKLFTSTKVSYQNSNVQPGIYTYVISSQSGNKISGQLMVQD